MMNKSKESFKLLVDAFKTYIQINQINEDEGRNVHGKLVEGVQNLVSIVTSANSKVLLLKLFHNTNLQLVFGVAIVIEEEQQRSW